MGTSLGPAGADFLPGSALLSVAGAAWAWALAALLGAAVVPRFCRREADEADAPSPAARLSTWSVVGISLQTTAWLALSWAGIVSPLSVVVTAAVLTVAAGLLGGASRCLGALGELRRSARGHLEAASAGAGGLWLAVPAAGALAVFSAAFLRLALVPTVFYDDLVYHLGLPRQALLTGSWPAMGGFHYSFMPAGWDAAYLLPLALGGGSGPQLMNSAALLLLAVAVARLARGAAGWPAALAVTALLLVGPMFGPLSAFAGNDLFVALALAVALERLVASGGRRPVEVGLAAGAAWGAKYAALPAVAGLALATSVMALRAARGARPRRLGRAAAVGAIVGLVALALPAAWTLRTWVLTGNPVFPAFWGQLGGEPWDAVSAAVVARDSAHGAFGQRGPAVFVVALFDLVFRSTQLGAPSGLNPVFPIVGLAGVALALAPPRAGGRFPGVGALLVTGGVAYAGWCVTSLNLRYAIVLLVVLAPFAARLLERLLSDVASRFGSRRAGVAVAAVLLLLVAGPGVGALATHLRLYGEPLGAWLSLGRSGELEARLALAAAGRHVAEDLPPEARVALVGDGRLALLPRPARASSHYDPPFVAALLEGAGEPAEVTRRFRERGFTHVLLNVRELSRAKARYRWEEHFPPGDVELLHRWGSEELQPLARWADVWLYALPQPAAGAPPP